MSGGPGSGTVVLGGGIVGLSAAYFLARRGERVTLLERDALGEGASSGNAGILAPGHPPLPRPGLPAQALRLLFDPGHPLYIAPRLDPGLARWLWSFFRACGTEPYARSLRLLAGLGRAADRCFRELAEEEGIDCSHRASGWMEVFRTSAALDHARRTADDLRRLDCPVDELSGDELRARDPVFLDSVRGALHFTEGGYADPRRFVLGLAEAATGRGVEILCGARATRPLSSGGRFRGVELEDGRIVEGERLVLAAGSWSSRLARRIGLRVPMQPGKGYHVDLDAGAARPGTTCVLAETFVAVTPLEGRLRLAGTVELSGLNLRVSRRRQERLRDGAGRYLSGIDAARVEATWCGLRPLTADGLPVIGWSRRVQGVYVATGHAMMGFLFGPLTGKLAAEEILDGSPSLEIGPLRADRF